MKLTLTTQLLIAASFWTFAATSAQAQGDPIPGPPPAAPPQTQVQTVTPIETPKIFLPPPPQVQIVPVNVLSNPSITPLDQRSGLIENAMKTNATQTQGGLSLGTATPTIKNSNLLGTGSTQPAVKVTTTSNSFGGVQTSFTGLQELLNNLAKVQNQATTSAIKAPTTTATTTTTVTTVTTDQKKNQLDEKLGKLNEAQNKMQEQIKTQEVQKVVNTVIPSPIVSTAVSLTTQAISLITGTGTSAAAKAVAPPAPKIPDPVAIFQGAMLQAKMAQMKMSPLLIQQVAVKAALGHFNDSSLLTVITNVLNTPGLNTTDGQMIVLSLLKATAQPTDIPIPVLAQLTQATSTPSTTKGVLKDTSSAIKELTNRATTMTALANNLQTSLNKNLVTIGTATTPIQAGDKQAMTAMIGALSTMIENLQTDLQSMVGKSQATIQSIFDAANESSQTMNQLFNSKAN